MNKNKFLFFGLHVLFSILLIYWFYTNSFIRPYAIFHPYKEIITAFLVLLIIYLNYLFLIPYYIKSSYYKLYIFLSFLVIGGAATAELLMVKTDIIKCFGDNAPFDISVFLFNTLSLIFLRNTGFYLIFTFLRLYLQTKDSALLDKKTVLKDTGFVLLQPFRGDPLTININVVSYFSQNKNYTFIHCTHGKPIPIYSSLNSIQNYLHDYCLRINKDIVITFTNIISYNKEGVMVKESKANVKQSFTFYKKSANEIFLTLRKKVPALEEKNDINYLKKQNDKINDDKKSKIDKIKTVILEEIYKHPSINTYDLIDILEEKTQTQISESTIRRRLKELRDAGIIEYRGSYKTGGYYAV
jgi:DNA-binding transcriptional ArsR family regulator